MLCVTLKAAILCPVQETAKYQSNYFYVGRIIYRITVLLLHSEELELPKATKEEKVVFSLRQWFLT